MRRRFWRNRLGVFGLASITALALVALLAPVIAASWPLVVRTREPITDLLGTTVLLEAGLHFPVFAGLSPLEWVGLGVAAGVGGAALCWSIARLAGCRRPRRRWSLLGAGGGGALALALALTLGDGRAHVLEQIDFYALDATAGPGEWSLWPPIEFSPAHLDRRADMWARPPWLDYDDDDDARERAERLGGKDWREIVGAHTLGTDDRQRDVLAMIVHGTRISLSVGFVAVGIYVLIGTFLGALAGYYGGIVDQLILRAIEVVSCFPTLILVIAVVALFPPSLYLVMAVIGVVGWPAVARLVRAEFLRLRGQEFVQAAIALGAGDARVVLRHILPNALAPILVAATFGVAGAILVESALSFIGVGVPVDIPSWGNLLRIGRQMPQIAWWVSLSAGLAILITIVSYNLFAEALRDALDPRLEA